MIETGAISMEQLNRQVSQCTHCPLWTTRTQVITGQGSLTAPLMLLGEAPGGHEDMVSGQAFTGEAGQHLEEFLQFIDIGRQEIYLTNTVKCRPTKPSPRGRYGPYSNRRPKASEIKACSHWLEQELKLVSPKIIATLGTVPLGRLLGKNIAMKDYHGRPFFSEQYQAWVFPLFHPAAIIYNRKIQPLYYADLAQLKEFIKMHL
ncbi:MAG: uracil-DNA glycosylase [Clostridia bacterium]|nr:uracil-DNA glycosylase [Clostridia bacterium]